MIRNLALLATAAAIVAVPQIAQAGCNGSACSALSSTTNYSATDKRVRATVTNKESNPIHLKFCVNVDYHCNGFEATLAARETITRDVSFNGPKPPQIHAVDVVTAEFPAQRPAAAGATAAPGAAASAAVLDTPRGKFTYLVAKQGVVVPLLTKAISYFKTVDSSFNEGKQHADKLDDLSEKLGSIKDVESEIAVLRNKDGGRVKDQAHIAKGAELQLSHFSSTLKLAESNAAYVTVNLKISEDDLRGAQDMERARELRADGEKAQAGLNAVFKLINTAADAAVIALSDPGSRINSAVAITQRLFDAVGGNPWFDEAEKLEARAQKVGAVNAEKKFAAAKTYMAQLKQQLNELKAKFPEYQALAQNTRGVAEESYDKIAHGQKSGNNFKFETLQLAMDEAQKTIDLARKVTEAAYGTREALRQLSQSAGDNSSWMAFPSEGRGIIDMMDSESKTAFDWGIKERHGAELLLKKFQDMYTVAREAMQ